jgi:hypothetical protein
MTDNIEADADGVNPVSADELEQVKRRVTLTFMVSKRTAEVQAIIEDALGFDDFTGLIRQPSELNDAERDEAYSKLNAALQGTFVQGSATPDKMIADAVQNSIVKDNEERAGEAVKSRPTVALEPSLLPRAIAKVERLLLMEAQRVENVKDRIFQRDGKLVRLSRNLLPPGTESDGEYRENNALLITEVKPKWLANRLDRTIMFVGRPAGKPKDGAKAKPVPKSASAELCARMIEDNTRWRHPHLFGTIEAPTLRSDGTVLDSPGYDKKTGLFFDPGATVFPKVPPRLTRDDGLTAIKRIEELLCDFPFQDAPGYEGVSLSVALAAILTGPVRRTLDIAPAFAVTAKEAETGKTELCKFIAGVTTGRAVSGQPFSDSEEERRKSIGGNLRSGRPILFFDNADNVVIEGDFLEKVITLPSVTDRVLSMTEEYSAPTNALVLFNGNNISVGGAMTTRVLQTRIVTETPLAQRSFQYPDLFNYVIEHRPELVWCVLIALRAWLINGERDETRATSRFQQWDSLIAQSLVWYGYADPMRGGDELREIDPVKEGQREVVRQWAMKHSDSTVTALDLQSTVEIRQAIADARDLREREINTKIVGHYVTNMEGVRLGLDWRVIRQAKVKGEVARWHLEYTGEGEPPAVDEDNENDFAPGSDDEDA